MSPQLVEPPQLNPQALNIPESGSESRHCGDPSTPVTAQIINAEFIEMLRAKFCLDWNGIHGVAHWTRVRANGLVLAQRNGANFRIVEYFAFLHDVCRQNENDDPDHASRAALFTRHIRDQYIKLNDQEFLLLASAIDGHTHGKHHNDLTVLTCWDADRLDLLRVGVNPESERMSTTDAKNPEIISRACDHAQTWMKTYLA